MKLENIDEAIKLGNTLKGLQDGLEEAHNMKRYTEEGKSISITEHDDGSGNFRISTVYENGDNYNALYVGLAKSVIKTFEKHITKIEDQLKEL